MDEDGESETRRARAVVGEGPGRMDEGGGVAGPKRMDVMRLMQSSAGCGCGVPV